MDTAIFIGVVFQKNAILYFDKNLPVGQINEGSSTSITNQVYVAFECIMPEENAHGCNIGSVGDLIEKYNAAWLTADVVPKNAVGDFKTIFRQNVEDIIGSSNPVVFKNAIFDEVGVPGSEKEIAASLV